jgi:hypothetical protein
MGSKEEAFCLRGKNARFALLQCNNRLEKQKRGKGCVKRLSRVLHLHGLLQFNQTVLAVCNNALAASQASPAGGLKLDAAEKHHV